MKHIATDTFKFALPDGREVCTFLTKAISHSFNSYDEPRRDGTPRGERIGFSKHKWLASGFMLTTKKHREIAKIVGTSHAVIRKWNCEKLFLDVVAMRVRSFAKFVIESIRENPRDYIGDEDLFADRSAYSFELQVEIRRQIIAAVERSKDYFEHAIALVAWALLVGIDDAEYAKLTWPFFEEDFTRSLEILDKEDITPADRDFLKMFLPVCRNMIRPRSA